MRLKCLIDRIRWWFMVKFPVNPHRQAPYKRFKFRVFWDAKPVTGISRVSGLRRTTESVPDRSGDDPSTDRFSPGLTSYDSIVLERGRTQDTAFEDWANNIHSSGRDLGNEVSLKDYKKDIRIELLNEAGQTVLRYLVFNCWPSEYTALSELDATVSETATESITLEHDGWERDDEVSEPEEPSLTTRSE